MDGVRAADPDGRWRVGEKATDSYDVSNGRLLAMHGHAADPHDTGLTSDTFLDVLALYAELVAAVPPGPSGERLRAALAGFAPRAAAVSFHAAALDWFGESWCRREEGR